MIKHLVLSFLISISFIVISIGHAEETKHIEGEYLGAKTATHPAWFKESFLDLDEDVSDATSQGKRLVLYFWQPGCPYCSQLWDENFSNPETVSFFRKNFEIISINMWGDREVVSVAGNDYTEKSFATALDIKYTPTLLFFDENKKVIHRTNGYLPADDFNLALKYVANKKEKEQSYSEYSTNQKATTKSSSKEISNLHQQPFFIKKGYNLDRSIQAQDKYLAVFFEEANCKNCDLLHEKTLKDEVTLSLVKQFDVVQLDRHSDTPVTTTKGVKTNAKEWAHKLNISYLPAIVYFDKNGEEVMRIDTQMRSFHIQSVFDYVLSESYKSETNFQRYISQRADQIRSKGISVDIWAY